MSQPAFPGRLKREDPDLSDRQRHVFAALVELHGLTARPVGSESLAQQSGIPLSPASIRNELAELEAIGLLERLHSSAGRVPSAKGYELFVRAMLTPAVLAAAVHDEVERALARSSQDVEHLLTEASRLLSSLTLQLGLACATSLDQERLSRLDLAPLADRRVLMLLDLGSGAVHTLALELESPLEPDQLEQVAAVLRERLMGHLLGEVRARLANDPELVRHSAVRMVARAATASWSRPVSTPLFSAGAGHIADQPEFSTAEQLGPILRMVEAGPPLDRLMVGSVEGQVAVRVGVDEDRALAGCSLVSYTLPGPVHGAVGILGPVRMDYSRAFAAVEMVGSQLTRWLQS